MSHSAKTELRAAMQVQRRGLSLSARRTQDRQLFEHIIRLPSIGHSKTLLMTLSFNGECDTWAFAQWAIERKGFIVLPRVEVAARILKLHRVDNLEQQVQSSFHGIHEPNSECPLIEPSEIEWLLLPGLAFDAHGGRLGYGGGYFDRLLAEVPSTAYRIALGYRFQLLSRIPTESHDQNIDTVVLPTGALQTRHLLTGL